MDGKTTAIRAEVAFWGLLVMANTSKDWWPILFLVIAVALRWQMWKLDKAMSGELPREGFWSRVWRR
jgi:hypothetical protein